LRKNVRLFVLAFLSLGVSQSVTAVSGGGASTPRSDAQLQQECDGGDEISFDKLGLRYYKNGKGSAPDLKKSAALFQRACDGGDAIGCSDLARSYLYGSGVKKDHRRAYSLAERACTGNSYMGCFMVGLAYQYGDEGYPEDVNKALGYYRLACGDGKKFDQACERVAELGGQRAAPVVAAAAPVVDPKAAALAANAAGVAAYNRREFAAAASQYDAACTGGEAMGCYNLANSYYRADGVPLNKPYALQLYTKSCAGGVALGCSGQASMTEKGEGIAANPGLARMLFAQACRGGYQPDCKRFEPVVPTAQAVNPKQGSLTYDDRMTDYLFRKNVLEGGLSYSFSGKEFVVYCLGFANGSVSFRGSLTMLNLNRHVDRLLPNMLDRISTEESMRSKVKSEDDGHLSLIALACRSVYPKMYPYDSIPND
jgi:uncharacterized protein